MQKKFANIDVKTMLAALIAALLCAVPLRTVQLFTNFEPHTGFFEAIDWTVFTVYGVLLFGAVLLLVLPMLSARLPASRPVIRQSYALTVGGLFFAVYLWQGFFLFLRFLFVCLASSEGKRDILFPITGGRFVF